MSLKFVSTLVKLNDPLNYQTISWNKNPYLVPTCKTVEKSKLA